MYNKRISQRQQQPQLPPIPNTILVEFRDCGKFQIMETFDFGYRIEVQSEVKPYQAQDGFWYIDYDCRKAGTLIKDNGYIFLCIKR